jgi:hypothetical protein
MTDTAHAIKVMVLTMLEGFPSSNFSVTDATMDAYALALHGIELQHIRTACGRFIRGQVDRKDHGRAPSAAELTQEAMRLQFDEQKRAAYDYANPRIQNVPDGYKTTADGRFLIVPPGKPKPPGFATIGPLKANYGHGEIDMSWMTPAEKRRVIESNGTDIPKRDERKSLVA